MQDQFQLPALSIQSRNELPLQEPFLGKNLFVRIKEEIKDFASIEQEPKMLGRQLIMVLNPLN